MTSSTTKKTYYIYHIPGQKIGMTCNLNKRVEIQQGYKSDEYEVLYSSRDVERTSSMERQLQKFYGYKVDRQSYANLIKIKSMKINATDQTSTFPVPVNKLKGHLHDNKGLTWETSHGEFEINDQTINWIIANAKPSMYNNERCFIYNKAFYEAFLNEEHTPPDLFSQSKFDLIRDWAQERGIYDKGDPKTQLIKLYEEAGELAQATLKNDREGIIDAIGDCIVVLTNLAHLNDLRVEDCISAAYDEISSRTGEMKNGTFVKDTL